MSVVIQEDFFADVKQFILTLFPDHKNYLQTHHWKDLMLVYENWISRLISPKPRPVLLSQEIKNSPFFTKFHNEISTIQNKIESGIDVKPHLSRGVYKFPTVANPTSKTSDKDGLLNDWGIHHFHLGSTIEKDGFISRTNELLFVKVFDDCVLFLEVFSHGNFSKTDLLRVIKNNWPQLIEPYRMSSSIIGLSEQFSDKEIGQLRKHGASSIIEIDGSFYSFGGIVTSGNSLESVNRVSRFHEFLLNLKNSIDEQKRNIQKAIFDKTGVIINELKIKLEFQNSPWLFPIKVYEENSSLILDEITFTER